MTDLAVWRRAVTCALASLPTIAFPAAIAAKSRGDQQGDEAMNMHTSIGTAATGHRREWEQALVEYRRAIAENASFHQQHYKPAADEIERRAPRPDLSISMGFPNIRRRLLPGELEELAKRPDLAAQVAPIRDAWRDFVVKQERAERDLSWAAIEAESETLCEKVTAAEDRLMEIPAPDVAAFALKVLIFHELGAEYGSYKDCLIRDAQQIADASEIRLLQS